MTVVLWLEPAKTIKPKRGLTLTPLRRGEKKKMVSRTDGESKQEAEVELYQMEINILSLVGHQYCKTNHFELCVCVFLKY